MRLLKNRAVLGTICIVLSLIICFALTPLFNQSVSQKTTIVRVVKDIQSGEQITRDMVQTVEVGGYNLPASLLTDTDAVIGKYAAADLSPGDYILAAKLTDSPAEENAYLYQLDGNKQAISVTIRSFAEGLSGKLASGDIVSIIAPDYKKQGSTVIPSELLYVEVIGVTASTGYDTDKEDAGSSDDGEKQLPATVTLLVTSDQAKILAELESECSLHLSLVYRGNEENAAKFIEVQDKVLEVLYPKLSGNQDSTGTTSADNVTDNGDTPADEDTTMDTGNEVQTTDTESEGS